MLDISLKQFHTLIKVFKLFFSLIFFSIIAKYFYDGYVIYEHNQSLIMNILNLGFLEKNVKPFLDISVQYGILFIWFIVKVCCLSILYYLFNRIPVPTSLFAQWHANNEISRILGRMIVYHYRYNSVCNVKELCFLLHYEAVQKYYLHLHANNPKIAVLFKTFDPDFDKDKT